MLTNLLLVALGGGLGAAGRWLLSLAPFPTGFPLATLLTNFLGAAAIGAIAALADRSALLAPAVLFLKTGVCGGFTTFPRSRWRPSPCSNAASTRRARCTHAEACSLALPAS